MIASAYDEAIGGYSLPGPSDDTPGAPPVAAAGAGRAGSVHDSPHCGGHDCSVSSMKNTSAESAELLDVLATAAAGGGESDDTRSPGPATNRADAAVLAKALQSTIDIMCSIPNIDFRMEGIHFPGGKRSTVGYNNTVFPYTDVLANIGPKMRLWPPTRDYFVQIFAPSRHMDLERAKTIIDRQIELQHNHVKAAASCLEQAKQDRDVAVASELSQKSAQNQLANSTDYSTERGDFGDDDPSFFNDDFDDARLPSVNTLAEVGKNALRECIIKKLGRHAESAPALGASPDDLEPRYLTNFFASTLEDPTLVYLSSLTLSAIDAHVMMQDDCSFDTMSCIYIMPDFVQHQNSDLWDGSASLSKRVHVTCIGVPNSLTASDSTLRLTICTCEIFALLNGRFKTHKDSLQKKCPHCIVVQAIEEAFRCNSAGLETVYLNLGR